MAVNYKRMLKLAKFLDKLPASRFSFGDERRTCQRSADNQCGTIGCAIGWTPNVFPHLVKAGKPIHGNMALRRKKHGSKRTVRMDWDRLADDLFSLPEGDGLSLFTPAMESPADGISLGWDATPKQVAKRIRTYVAWSKKQAKR